MNRIKSSPTHCLVLQLVEVYVIRAVGERKNTNHGVLLLEHLLSRNNRRGGKKSYRLLILLPNCLFAKSRYCCQSYKVKSCFPVRI